MMRLWRVTLQNMIGDTVLIVAVLSAAIGITLLLSDILMDIFGK